MTQANPNDFQARLSVVRHAYAKGRRLRVEGMAAVGPMRSFSETALWAGVLGFAFCLGLKGGLHSTLGAEGYASQIEALHDAGAIGQVQGFLLGVDPVTLAVSYVIGQVV